MSKDWCYLLKMSSSIFPTKSSPDTLATVLSVLLRFTDSDYPFGIFKLFLCH